MFQFDLLKSSTSGLVDSQYEFTLRTAGSASASCKRRKCVVEMFSSAGKVNAVVTELAIALTVFGVLVFPLAVEVVNFRRHGDIGKRIEHVVDDDNRMVVVAVQHVQRLAGDFRGEVRRSRPQVIIVQMPDHRRPGVVQHPLNFTGRFELVGAKSFIHRADRFVSLGLRFPGEIGDAGRFPEPCIERLGEIASSS